MRTMTGELVSDSSSSNGDYSYATSYYVIQ